MDKERVIQLLERQFRGWESPDGVPDLVADFGVTGTFFHPVDPPTTGAAAIRVLYDRFHERFRDATFALGPVALDGDLAAFEWTYEYTVVKTGRRTRIPGLTIACLRPDGIDRYTDYWDTRCLSDYLAEGCPGQRRRPIGVVDAPPEFDAETVTRRQIAGWDDPDALESMYSDFAPDAVFTDPVTPPTDLAGLRDVFERVHRLSHRIRTTLVTRIAAGPYLILEWSIVSHGRRSDRESRMTGASWIELRDGTIRAWRDYWDTEQVRPRRGAGADVPVE